MVRASAFVSSPALLSRNRSAFSHTSPISHTSRLSRRVAALRVPLRAQQMTEELPPDPTRTPEEGILDPEAGSVVIAPSFNLAAGFMFTGGVCFYLGDVFLVPGFPALLIGLLLSVQSFRIRFIFGPRKLSVAQRKGRDLDFLRGWEYEKITNWELWWPPLPILAYFKESESYNGRGSIHFFPVLCDGKQLLDMLKERTPHLDKSDYS